MRVPEFGAHAESGVQVNLAQAPTDVLNHGRTIRKSAHAII